MTVSQDNLLSYSSTACTKTTKQINEMIHSLRNEEDGHESGQIFGITIQVRKYQKIHGAYTVTAHIREIRVELRGKRFNMAK